MITYLQPVKKKLHRFMSYTRGFVLKVKKVMRDQFDKNIYTRILFTNVTIFLMATIGLTIFSSNVVKQVTYDQAQQELLRKAKRVNYALLQQMDPVWEDEPAGQTGAQAQGRENMLKIMAGIFDTRITVFDPEGFILDSSAEQDVIPGSKIEMKYVHKLTPGEVVINRTEEQETGRPVLTAVVPMGHNIDVIESGILLEAEPLNIDLALNKTHLSLVAGGAVTLVIIIFASVYLAMSISRPISRLSTIVSENSRDSFVISAEDQPMDEINTLAGQLNKLAIKLQKIQSESSRMEEDRSRMLAEISHELRTPLTAVQGFVEAIRDGIVQDEALRERYLDTIYTQTVHITRLVDDILALSRLESGAITVEKLPVDLVALAQGVAVSMEAEAEGRNTSIQVEKKTENAIVTGDADRMEQILKNLLKNALRATENGTIAIGVEKCRGEVLLTVKDDGIGISPADLPHIWDRFYRVKNQRDSSWKEKGSGLGLVIVKKLVQLQGGKIEVASRLGEGTVFTIAFPSFDENR